MCDSFGHHTPHLSVHDYAMVLLGQQIPLSLFCKRFNPITTKVVEIFYVKTGKGSLNEKERKLVLVRHYNPMVRELRLEPVEGRSESNHKKIQTALERNSD